MENNTKYIRYTWLVVVMVFLVILAGSVVRNTQSGMGCPDWPKCFGRWIPPTSASQLPADYEKYLRQQDIDHTFNAYHTWIEYSNRLLGALLGVFILVHFIWSYVRFRKTRMSIVWASLFLLMAVGFQGWLGKKVVDANLAVVKITTHMLVALLIASIPLYIIDRLRPGKKLLDQVLKRLSLAVLFLLLVQIVLGTQVREQIDEISASLSYQQRNLWIGQLDKVFVFHRSFSIVILGVCLLLSWMGWRYIILRKNIILIMSVVLATILLGVIMAWFHIPALAQPLHLLMAVILALSVFTFSLRLK